MRKICLIVIAAMWITNSNAQKILIASKGTVHIMKKTDVHFSGLTLIPAGNTTLNAQSIIKDTILHNSFSNPYIKRTYRLTDTPVFTGTVRVSYHDGELNSVNESALQLAINNGSTWQSVGSNLVNGISNHVLTTGISMQPMNELLWSAPLTNIRTWTGAISTRWDTAANWSPIAIPSALDTAIIPVVANQPTLSVVTTVKAITMAPSTTLSLQATTVLNVTHNVINNGTIDGPGQITLAGNTLQNISGMGTISNLQLSNSSGATIASGSTAQNLTGELAITAGTLTTSGNLTLKSTATGDARIASIAPGAISGAVTVERYIPASGRRAWRLLATPLSSSGAPTIYNSWQEGGAAPAGFGTWITDPGFTVTNGYDATSTSTSLQYWNGSSLVNPSNTKVDLVTSHGGAHFLFVRGDRSITGAGVSNNTTLRMKGVVNQGTVTVGATGAALSLIPNPYASPVDFEAITMDVSNGSGATLNTFHIWNAQAANAGAYNTVVRTAANTYEVTPFGGSMASDNTARYIRSGQAFFIPTNTQVTFKEAMKTNALPVINPFKTTSGEEQLIMNLNIVNNNGNVLADGIRVKFDAGYTAAVTAEDVVKFNNFSENIAVNNSNTNLVVEKRPLVTVNDTIHLKLWNTAARDYQFSFMPHNISANNTAYLIDAYLNTTTIIDLTTSGDYNFNVTSVAGSYDVNRFKIVFNVQATSMPSIAAANEKSLSIYPNPVRGKSFNLQMNGLSKGRYSAVLYNSMGQKVVLHKIDHQGGTGTYRIGLSGNITVGTYQLVLIKSTGNEKLVTQLVID